MVAAPPPVRDLAESLEFTGNAAAIGTNEVKVRVSGFITQMHFEDGQRVKQSDPLFTIDKRHSAVVRDQAKALAEMEELKLRLTTCP